MLAASPLLYQWRQGRAAGFKSQLCYAWFIYIENGNELDRIRSAHSLNLILMAARTHGLNNKLIEDFTGADYRKVEQALHSAFISPKTRRATELFLLKFLYILQERKNLEINLIDVAVHFT